MSDKAPSPKGSIGKGIGLLALLHILHLFYPIALIAIGLTQLIYAIPLLLYYRKETSTMQGVLIGAGITFLLNAACFGIVIGGIN